MTTTLLLFATLVRNPFTPVDYDGGFERISLEPRVVLEQPDSAREKEADTATSAAQIAREGLDKKDDVQSRHWMDARKTLRITGTARAQNADGTEKQSVIINGLTYGNGDLISVNHHGRRFTWRIEGFVPGESLRLVRVKARVLADEKK